MGIPRTGAATASALCVLVLALATAAAATAPADSVEPDQRIQATAGRHPSAGEGRTVAIPRGADREDVPVVASDPAMAWDRRWAAEVHRIAQSMATPAGRSEGVSFAWRDAGAGALAALGLVAVLGVGAYGLRARTARTTARGA